MAALSIHKASIGSSIFLVYVIIFNIFRVYDGLPGARIMYSSLFVVRHSCTQKMKSYFDNMKKIYIHIERLYIYIYIYIYIRR